MACAEIQVTARDRETRKTSEIDRCADAERAGPSGSVCSSNRTSKAELANGVWIWGGGAETFQDRAARCTHQAGVFGQGATAAACVDGGDLRRQPLRQRKLALQKLLIRSLGGIQHVEHSEGHGGRMFDAVCKLGLEGIVLESRQLQRG